MKFVTVLRHNFYCLFDRVLIIKFDPERTLGKFAVVIDADIFDAYIMGGWRHP